MNEWRRAHRDEVQSYINKYKQKLDIIWIDDLIAGEWHMIEGADDEERLVQRLCNESFPDMEVSRYAG